MQQVEPGTYCLLLQCMGKNHHREIAKSEIGHHISLAGFPKSLIWLVWFWVFKSILNRVPKLLGLEHGLYFEAPKDFCPSKIEMLKLCHCMSWLNFISLGKKNRNLVLSFSLKTLIPRLLEQSKNIDGKTLLCVSLIAEK